MRRIDWIGGFALAAGIPALAWTQDSVLLRIQLPEGSSWKVEQVLEESHESRSVGGVAGVVAGKSKSSARTVHDVIYTDDCVEDRGGSPTQVRRTYARARAKSTLGDWTHPLEGSVLLLRGNEGATAVEAKVESGKPDSRTLEQVEGAPIDPVALLLPGDAVRADSTWTVPATKVVAFHRAVGAGLTSPKSKIEGSEKLDGAMADLSDAMQDLDNAMADLSDAMADVKNAGADLDVPAALDARVRSLQGGEAVIEYACQTAPRSAGIAGAPAAGTEIKATLVFDLAAGRPKRLEWRETVTSESTGSVSIAGVTTGGTSSNTSKWTLRRSVREGK
jgi:hypothetical protein